MKGLEMHLQEFTSKLKRSQPQLVIVDPITSFLSSGTDSETSSMMLRLVDYLKSRQITGPDRCRSSMLRIGTFRGIQPQIRFTGFGVETMTLKAVRRQNRPHVTVELCIPLRLSAGMKSQKRCGSATEQKRSMPQHQTDSGDRCSKASCRHTDFHPQTRRFQDCPATQPALIDFGATEKRNSCSR
jgi:hypothetical protein